MALRILLAESDSKIARLVMYCLEGHGHTVFHCAGGIEALTLAYQELPDLILLDQTLPNLSGRLVLEGLREDQRTRHIPVLLISSQPDQPPPAGAQGLLPKPFTPAQILEAISRFDLTRKDAIEGGEVLWQRRC